MNDQFRPDECLFRAILPRDDLWEPNGQPSSAAFKDPQRQGLSVERDKGRPLEEAADFLLSHLSGAAVYVTVSNCIECSAIVRPRPTPKNEYHSEIHKSENEKLLSNSQANYLSKHAVVFRR